MESDDRREQRKTPRTTERTSQTIDRTPHADGRVPPVFVHISKNAGTSIVATAGEQIVNAGHRTAARWMADHGSSHPMFAVLRHPFDRVLSEYHYRRNRWTSGEANPHLANLHLPFDEWVSATLGDGEFRTRSFFERTGVPFNEGNMVNDQLIWFIPQVEWVTDADAQLLVGDLLRFEQLADDWSAFCAKHGIDVALQHANQSPRPIGFEQVTSPHTRELIHCHYRADFERFGYE